MSFFESNSFLIGSEFNGAQKIYSCEFYVEIKPENYFARQRPYRRHKVSSNFPPVQLIYSLFAERIADPFQGTRYADGRYEPNPANHYIGRLYSFDKTGLIFYCEAEDINNVAGIYHAISWNVQGFIYNPCTEYELLCDSEYYPGWLCVPYEKISKELQEIDRGLRGK